MTLMLLGAMMWGNVIATFCGIIATLNPAEVEYRQTMDDLNRFMRLQSLPQEMRRRLREYFHQTKHLQQAASHRSLLATMSPTLQGEVALQVNSRWLSRVWFLRGVEDPFMVQVALHLHAMVFAPGELAAAGYLYIVHRGVALYLGRVVNAGKVWGEDMILNAERLRYNIAARALNYLEVYIIGRRELFEVAQAFPTSHKHIRMCAAKLALSREVLFRARKERAANFAESLVGGASATKTFDRILAKASASESTSLQSRIQEQAMYSQMQQRQMGRGMRGSACAGKFAASRGGAFNRTGRLSTETISFSSLAYANAPSLISEATSGDSAAGGGEKPSDGQAIAAMQQQLQLVTRMLQALLPATEYARIEQEHRQSGGSAAREGSHSGVSDDRTYQSGRTWGSLSLRDLGETLCGGLTPSNKPTPTTSSTPPAASATESVQATGSGRASEERGRDRTSSSPSLSSLWA